MFPSSGAVSSGDAVVSLSNYLRPSFSVAQQ